MWPCYRGNSLLSSTLPDACELGDFHFDWWEYGLSQALWGFEDCSLQFSCVGFPPASGGFLTLMCWSILRWALQRDPLKISEASLSMQPFPPVFILVTLSVDTLSFLEFQLLLLHLGRLPGSTWVFLPELLSWNSLQTISQDNGRAHLICFSSIRNHCPKPANIQCL